jgi:hypothetical protein
MPEIDALCGQSPIDQQGQRDGAHARRRGSHAANSGAGRLSDESLDLLRVRLRHDFLLGLIE